MMENQLVEQKNIMVTPEQKNLVKSIIFPGCNDNELALFLFECARRGVHPLDRVIFPISRNDTASGTKKITFQCGIDFFRAEAADTGEYDGQDEPEFGASNKDGYPESATVKVYKKGIDRPITGTARWAEFYPGEKLGFMWRKMPFHMLSKCAEVLALRKAFPKRLSGLYIPEEINIETTKTPVKQPQKKAEAQTDPTKISEAQKKRFYAIAKGTGFSDEEIKAHLLSLNIEHPADILKSQYDGLCTWAEAKEREAGAEK